MTNTRGTKDGTRTACGCKVGRKAEQYCLDDLDEQLYRRHQDGGASLRSLETYVNERILESALREANVRTVGDSSELYHRLTTDEVSAGDKAELRARLKQAGVEIDRVEADYVTYQTIRTHLRESLGIDTSGKSDFSISDARTRISRLQSRSEAVIVDTLERLRRTDELQTGDLDVIISTRVTCEECGDSYPLSQLIKRDHCQCGGETQATASIEGNRSVRTQ